MNLLVKKQEPLYVISLSDSIATKLSKKKFEELQELNDFLKEYRFIPHSETDFSWWDRVDMYMTDRKLYTNQDFYCDYYGKVKRC